MPGFTENWRLFLYFMQTANAAINASKKPGSGLSDRDVLEVLNKDQPVKLAEPSE